MNDIMIDLETMDNVASSSIVSIGAVECDLITGETGSEYYRVVSLEGQIDNGLTIWHETLEWWMGQSDGARHSLTRDNKELPVSLCESFTKWINSLKAPVENIRLWGNGASFDNAIIRHFFRVYGLNFPIKFWNDRDMRTILGFYPKSLQEQYRKNNMRVGTYHNALDDCKHQIKYCSHILQELGVKELA